MLSDDEKLNHALTHLAHEVIVVQGHTTGCRCKVCVQGMKVIVAINNLRDQWTKYQTLRDAAAPFQSHFKGGK